MVSLRTLQFQHYTEEVVMSKEVMTVDEMRDMIGTDFVYRFESGAEIPATVAAFSPTVGLSLIALSERDTNEYDWSFAKNENGDICVCAVHVWAGEEDRAMSYCSEILSSIKEQGWFGTPNYSGETSVSPPACPF